MGDDRTRPSLCKSNLLKREQTNTVLFSHILWMSFLEQCSDRVEDYLNQTTWPRVYDRFWRELVTWLEEMGWKVQLRPNTFDGCPSQTNVAGGGEPLAWTRSR